MRPIVFAIAILVSAGAAEAAVPFFNATCPGNISVHADQGGPVYINGKQAKLQTYNRNYYEARHGNVTISLSIRPDGTPSVSYTKGSANGICQIASGKRGGSNIGPGGNNIGPGGGNMGPGWHNAGPGGSMGPGWNNAGPGGMGLGPNSNPDYADGMAGGPDYWRVAGVPRNDTLNVRSGAGTNHPVIGELANGDIVRNLGCERMGSSRWCRIETRQKFKGWVNGSFLRESGPPR